MQIPSSKPRTSLTSLCYNDFNTSVSRNEIWWFGEYLDRGMYPPRCNIPMVAARASCLKLDIVVTGTVQDDW